MLTCNKLDSKKSKNEMIAGLEVTKISWKVIKK